jgi:nicotinamide riboside transporter PnuC
MVRGARYLYAALAWAFVAGVILQVFFIGLGLFVGPENLALHVNFGWLLHLGPLPILLAAALARAGRRRILQTAALAILVFFVPILAVFRTDAPLAAAFHPVGALLAFWLATVVARGATSLARTAYAEASTTRGEWVLVGLVVLILLALGLGGSPA